MKQKKSQDPLSAQHILEQTEAYLPVDEHIEYVSEDGKSVPHKGVFLLPNLFTTAALFCGFYSVLSSIQGQFEQAVLAIFAAGFFDMLDGRVARLLNAQSAFGVEYDSLSDLISFGAAPAILAFTWGLMPLGKLGWVLAFVYLCCAALRLARFNTQASEEATAFFSGLASPAAAGTVTSFVWLMYDRGVQPLDLSSFLLVSFCLVTFLSSVLMVSNFPYYSFKSFKMKGRVPYAMLLVVIFIMMFIAIDPPLFFFSFGVIYSLVGIGIFVYKKITPAPLSD